MISIRSDTPIERYQIKGHTVYVKRDDLCVDHPQMPPIAKGRGIVSHLEKLKAQGVTRVGLCITPISRSGQAVAVACQELELGCHIYVRTKSRISMLDLGAPQHKIAMKAGAEVSLIQLPTTEDVYAFAKRDTTDNGITLLPRFLALPETVEAIKKEAGILPVDLAKGTIVVCVGRGTILAGIMAGVRMLPSLVVGVEVGEVAGIKQGIRELLKPYKGSPLIPALFNIKLIPSPYEYYQKAKIEAPFPADPYYDAKAFEWLIDNINDLEEPILFWNIG